LPGSVGAHCSIPNDHASGVHAQSSGHGRFGWPALLPGRVSTIAAAVSRAQIAVQSLSLHFSPRRAATATGFAVHIPT